MPPGVMWGSHSLSDYWMINSLRCFAAARLPSRFFISSISMRLPERASSSAGVVAPFRPQAGQ